MMPMRFVSLEKGKLARISYFSSSWLGLVTISSFLLLSFMMKPSSYANFTKAISSGLEAWSTLTPSSVTGVTLLQRINAVAKSLCKNYCLLFAFFFTLNNLKHTIMGHADPPEGQGTSYKHVWYPFSDHPNHQSCREFHSEKVFWRPYHYKSKYLFYHSEDTRFDPVIQE